MFTWICPQCGGEVLPSQEECPRCVKAAQPPAPAPAAESVSVPPLPVPPAQPVAPAPGPVPVAAPAPVFPVAAAPVYYHPVEQPRSTVVRDLLVMLGVAAVLLGIGYYVWNRNEQGEADSAKSAAGLETVKTRAAHPLAKQIEVTGIRLRMPKPGQAEVQLVVVNHSAAEIAELAMDVVLGGKGSAKEVAVFPIKVKRLGPFESTEVTAKAKTGVSAIDLPDWQFLEAKVSIQSNEP